MKKPITLYIPEYYKEQILDEHSLKLSKTKSLVKKEHNKAFFLASIEPLENYQCSIQEIPSTYLQIASNCLQRDMEENWALHDKINDCKVYTYNWDDKICHFRIYWIILSKKYLLQLTGIFQPQYSGFYKSHFMRYALATQIDTSFDFSKEQHPNTIFNPIKVSVDINDLKERIVHQEKQKKEKLFLEENLKISNPNFYKLLGLELKKKEVVILNNFMCIDWNVYYNLYNPENFSNPDSTIEWEDNSDLFEYYKTPFTDNSKISIISNRVTTVIGVLKKLVENRKTVEQNLLSFFENYTFGGKGAYAAAIHYKYAKIELERLHKTKYTNKAFLKRNLCLLEIELLEKSTELKLHFACSWDMEHGINLILNGNFHKNSNTIFKIIKQS